jgi:hypothetical protein
VVNPNYVGLLTRLEGKNRPQIVHYIGHGRYNAAKRQGEVALTKVGDGEEVAWIDQDQFQRLFTESGCIPRLLFLQLCEGAKVESEELIVGFAGLTPALISAGIQAVVAMQFPIKNVHAGSISTKFYAELTKGRTVGEAVQAARHLVFNLDPLSGGTPVLYMFGYDGAIVAAPSTGSQTTGSGYPAFGSPGSAGTLAGMPEPAPTPAPAGPSQVPERPSTPPAVRAPSATLNEILGAASRAIEVTRGRLPKPLANIRPGSCLTVALNSLGNQ